MKTEKDLIKKFERKLDRFSRNNGSNSKNSKKSGLENSLEKKEMYLKQTDRNYKDGDRN